MIKRHFVLVHISFLYDGLSCQHLISFGKKDVNTVAKLAENRRSNYGTHGQLLRVSRCIHINDCIYDHTSTNSRNHLQIGQGFVDHNDVSSLTAWRQIFKETDIQLV